ncbi:MAG: hypothetical protein E3J56_06940 [Candidatus Aminicenantes bacterium]|nr:MAG: hypothetical protein E3J56_06940 [Candidatus Aminicenantes bacterium]
MSYKEGVGSRITGDANALGRRKEFWQEIVSAYEKEGEDGVKSILSKRSCSITEEFSKLLRRLEEKL